MINKSSAVVKMATQPCKPVGVLNNGEALRVSFVNKL